MAGAGKRTFIAGEVLTAAQVNDYLMDQAVMRFSGSAARAASITAPTEGMVTYLDDTNSLEFYDGAGWQPADLRRFVTGSAQVLVGAASGSVIAVGGGTEGQVLTAASAQPGGVTWATPGGAGAAAFLSVTASGTTALPAPLTPGFYRIGLSTTESFTDEQWRFVDSNGYFYGATITSGTGFFTLPVTAASLNLTKGTFPINVLIEEIAGVTNTLPTAPIVTAFGWQTTAAGSVAATVSPTAASIGTFNPLTGKFINLGPASVTTASLFATADFNGVLNTQYPLNLVQNNPTGLWSTASTFPTPAYPFAIFTGNGTYVPPPWSTTADVVVVSGGAGSGDGTSPSAVSGGGGGAGGASFYSDVATPGSVAVTVGAAGTGLGQGPTPAALGGNSSFGPRATNGGGYGGGDTVAAGSPGGSGGGGRGGPSPNAAGTGIAGQGTNGVAGTTGPAQPSGAGGSHLPTGASVAFGVRIAGGGANSVGSGGSPSLRGGGGNGVVFSGSPGGNSGQAGIVIVRAK